MGCVSSKYRVYPIKFQKSDIEYNSNECIICLAGFKNTNKVKKIASHPQVFGQCSTWIREHYPEAEKIITTSTAEAAKLAQNDRNIYCIG